MKEKGVSVQVSPLSVVKIMIGFGIIFTVVEVVTGEQRASPVAVI